MSCKFVVSYWQTNQCNHELHVMCHYRSCHHCRYCHCHLWTVLLAIDLITETSYLAPSICMWVIKFMQLVFFKWEPFKLISLCASPDYIVLLRTFIFGKGMYWGDKHRRNYAPLDNILKIIHSNSHWTKFTFYTFVPMHNVLCGTHYNRGFSKWNPGSLSVWQKILTRISFWKYLMNSLCYLSCFKMVSISFIFFGIYV